MPPLHPFIAAMRAAPAFKRARFHVRRNGRQTKRLIIGIGQMHAVSQGRFERFQARQIAKVQYWIFLACLWMADHGVHAFGQEGLSNQGEGTFYGRLPAELLKELKEAIQRPEGVSWYLRKTAQKWRKALRKGSDRDIRKSLQGLDALNVLQALDQRISVFPIEQENIHGPLSQALGELHREIAKIERSKEYRAVIAKDGKWLTKEEYDSAVERDSLVKEYNALLKNEHRDNAIFEEILRYAEERKVTVFILGQGHRQPMLERAKQELPPETAFVWVTPAPLWWPAFLTKLLLTAFAVITALGAFWWAS